MNRQFLIFTLIALCLPLAGVRLARSQASSLDESTVDSVDLEVISQFFGTTGLAELSAGALGRGTLLYYAVGDHPMRPRLVVQIVHEPGADHATAQVFDAPPGARYVPIQLDGEKISLPSRLLPAITIQARGGWWVRDETINYNLDVQVNGPIDAMWGGGFDPRFGPSGWVAAMRPGEPAARILVRDPAGSGVPTWDLRSLLRDFPGQGYYRTNYAERTCLSPLTHDLGVSPQWPYVAQGGGYEQPNGRLRPPIVVDWGHSRITHFSELVTVRNQNCSYALYAINRLTPGRRNQPDFESPFAFYDLSGQGKGYPNLIVRAGRFPANDPWSAGLEPTVRPRRPVPVDYEAVRYSWRLAPGDSLWDYKIEVLGFHPYTADTPIADGYASIDAPSSAQLPDWVVDQPWPAVSFVDTEGKSYQSSEGIYEWTPSDLGAGYLAGWDTDPHPDAFSTIPLGFRGEYRFHQSRPPRLYLSPLDRRLHLLGAEGGLWNLGNAAVLRTLNLDHGPYINGWVRERSAERAGALPQVAAEQGSRDSIEEALYALAGYLIYSGPTGIELRRVADHPADFEIAPPTDPETWASFRERLAPYDAQRRDPNDLKSWLTPVVGESLTISQASIRQVRSTPTGFRFILTLGVGFDVQGSEIFHRPDLVPGSYAVTYTDGRFTINPLTPPSITGELDDTTSYTTPFVALQPRAVSVRLRNDGLTDLPDSTLELWAQPSNGPPILAATRSVALLAQDPAAATLVWTPPAAGDWVLTPKIRQPDGARITLEPARTAVAPAASAGAGDILSISAPTGSFALLAVALGLAGALIGLTLVPHDLKGHPESRDETG